MPKVYEQQQLVEPRNWENSSRDWTAKGQRMKYEFRRCLVPTHVSLSLTARAPAKVSFGVLNVDFVCAGPDGDAFPICLLGRAGRYKPKFRRRLLRLDRDWTSSTSELLPIRGTSLPSCFRLYGETTAMPNVAPRFDFAGSRLDREASLQES